MTCRAVRYNDQMMCSRCGLAWDVGDPEPPACRAEQSQGADSCNASRETGQYWLQRIRKILSER